MNNMTTTTTLTKAEQVVLAYNDASYDYDSEACYCFARATAQELGGVEIYNSNDDEYHPGREFKFEDNSLAYITLAGVSSM